MQSNPFLIQSKPIAIAISLTNWASWKFLAATTAVFSFAMLGEFLSGYFSGTQFYFFLFIGTGMVYLIIDAGLSTMLKWMFKIKGTEMSKSEKTFSHFIVLLLIFKVAATMTSSLWAAPEIADAITDNNTEKELIGHLLKTDSSQTRQEQEAAQRLYRLEATEADRIALAREEGQRLVDEAVRLGNHWQRSSFHKIGFAWLLSADNDDTDDHDYAHRIQAAQATAMQLIEEARNRTIMAAANVGAVVSDSTYHAKSTLLTNIAADEHQAFKNKKQRRKGYIWIADIFATLLGLFCTFLLALREKAGGVPIRTKNVGAVVGAFIEKTHADFINALENMLGVDIDGDGKIGGGETAKTTVSNNPSPTVETPPLAVAKTIGFKIGETTVKQPFGEETRFVQTIVSNNDVTYWKQRLGQSFRRMHTQLDPATPTKNFKAYKSKLEKLGFKIEIIEGKLAIIEPED